MDAEMEALQKNHTWDMVPLPIGKKAVGWKLVYTPKFNADKSLERYKTRLVAKGYTQSYGIDYLETFAAAKLNWEIHQFNVKNVFLHGELEEEVYMTIPLGYPLFNQSGVSLILSLGRLRYFLGIEVAHSKEAYRILVYLKNIVGQGLLFSRGGDNTVEIYTDIDYAGSVSDRRSTSGSCSFVGGNLVSWRSKKQKVRSRSSAEAEFRAMAQGTCEAIWIKILFEDLHLYSQGCIKLYYDNQSAIAIAHNLVQHDRTKHIEIDRQG
ncbi:unnamed protein product [Spirodela intermedia]|uniref:Reverse transcriptase Ty1/copia-type domain-containing protein n=1 Tax=Spirodela intermedia TaxID=51605 RepID=A0A7I8JYA3_SPIIN|nr:unnamed protein product [Spirodela intermedia]